jgi:transcriptional regulator with XRE-family HTH domain
MCQFGANLRRLMAREGLSIDQVTELTGLDHRTIKSILNRASKPHARTLHRLAQGLGVSADELFQPPSLLAHHAFDRQTNPAVQSVVRSHPELFHDWTPADFDELYSRVGTGGELNEAGTVAAAGRMNSRREILTKVQELLESSEAALLTGLIDLLYEKMTVGGE